MIDTCNLPNADQIRGIAIDYNGHGTTTEDVLIVTVIVLTFVCIAFAIAWANVRMNARRS